MLPIWLLGLGMAVALSKKASPLRRVLRRGTTYRYLQEFDRVTDAEVAQIQKSTGWQLQRRERDRAMFVGYATAAEDAEIEVPSPWQMIAGLMFVESNDTEGRWRVHDVRAPES